MLEGLAEGDVFESKQFTSSSLYIGTALSFTTGSTGGATVMEIKAKSGGVMGEHSNFPGEMELVQSPGTRYRFLGREKAKAGGKEFIVCKFEEI